VVYLHSALTKARVSCRDDAERRELLRFQRLDVLVALGAAGLVNLAMLFVAAALFGHAGSGGGAGAGGGSGGGAGAGGGGRLAAGSLAVAHSDLGRLVGGGAALAFAIALLASGLSSSSVGTYAGQVVMQGFIGRSVPLFLRRALTMLPALIVLAAGLPPTTCLVLSQVVLSFGVPFALVPLVALTRRTDVMGALVNRRLTTLAAAGAAALIIAMNAYLLAAAL
jgi:manganese transport protein